MYFVALGLSRLSDIKEDLLSKVMSHVLSAGIHMHPFITPYTCDLCAENIYFFKFKKYTIIGFSAYLFGLKLMQFKK